MLLHKIHDRVHDRIEDTTYWTDARITGLANQCLDDIVSNNPTLGVKSYATFSTVADQQTYVLPSNYVDTEILYINSTYNRNITVLNSPNEIYGVTSDPETTGVPTHAYFWGIEDQPDLWFYPVPDDAYSMKHFYYALCAELVNDDDEPQIPRALHVHIVDYCIWGAKVEDEILSEGDFKVMWNLSLKEIAGFVTKQATHGNSVAPGDARGMFPGTVGGNTPSVTLNSSTYRW